MQRNQLFVQNCVSCLPHQRNIGNADIINRMAIQAHLSALNYCFESGYNLRLRDRLAMAAGYLTFFNLPRPATAATTTTTTATA